MATDVISALTQIMALREANDAIIRDWGENIPITLLFSMLGKAIAENIENLSHDERVYVFGVLERGIKDSDSVVSTAVATGLLEALEEKTFNDNNLSKIIETYMGTECISYLSEWRKLTNLQ